MPLKDDLFQRTIDKLGEITKALLSISEQKDLAAAEQAIEEAYAQHLASKGSVLRQLSTDQLIEILSTAGNVDKEKAYLLGSIFFAEIELERTKAQTINTSKQLKALDLFLEAAIDDVDADDVHQRINSLEIALDDYELPELTHWRFFDYAQYTGKYAIAEDRLFSTVEQFGITDTSRQKGEAFYLRLLDMKDNELEKGNLPREEVLEGKLEFESQLSS